MRSVHLRALLPPVAIEPVCRHPGINLSQQNLLPIDSSSPVDQKRWPTVQSNTVCSLTLQTSPKPHPVGGVQWSSCGSGLTPPGPIRVDLLGHRAQQPRVGCNREMAGHRQGRAGMPDLEEWDSREGLLGGESDPPAEQIPGAVRPHMKVQKSRAPATAWAWRAGPVKREASW